MQLLASAGHEQAALARGVPDAVDRGTKLRQALQLVDPDFDFDLTLGDQQTVVHIRPRDERVLGDVNSNWPRRDGLNWLQPVAGVSEDASTCDAVSS